MKITLTLQDRIVMPTVLPERGSFEDMIIREDIREKVQLSQKETSKYKIIQDKETGYLSWVESDDSFDYEFTELEENLIIKNLKEMSDNKKLTSSHLGLYKKFVSKTEKKK
jgi:hypothetical protein